MDSKSFRGALVYAILLVLTPCAARANTSYLNPTKYLTTMDIPAADRPAGALLGARTVIRGEWAFVGSLWAEAVFVFRNTSGTWQYWQKLTGAGPAWSPALFGAALAVSDTGDVLVVGAASEDHVAPGDNRGAAYVFHLFGSTQTWIRVAQLKAFDAANGGGFGGAVAIRGNTIALVGASFGGPAGTGSVYAYRRPFGTTWNYVTRFVSSSTSALHYGSAIAAGRDGWGHEWLAIGAPSSESGRGFVEMVEWEPATGAVYARDVLRAFDGAAQDGFGFSVSIAPQGGRLLVGSPFADINGQAEEGAAYFFELAGSSLPSHSVWVGGPKLTTPPYSSGGKAGDRFGLSVNLQNDWALVGSPDFGGFGQQYGAVFAFVRSGASWQWSNVALAANDEYADNDFGVWVHSDGSRVVVGAYFDNTDGQPSNGSVHVYDVYWQLAVSVAGLGSGRVTSNPGPLDCSPSSGPCASMFKTNTYVTLTATPDAGSTFAGWAGDCTAGEAWMDRPFVCTATFSRAGADLIVRSVSNIPARIALNESLALADTTANVGSTAAATSVTRYFLSTDPVRNAGDVLIGGHQVTTLEASQSQSATKIVTVKASTRVGRYYVLACADAGDAVIETDDTNNCLTSLSTTEVVAPDLLETTIATSATSVVRGGTFTVTDTVANLGTASAAESTTLYFLSLNSKMDKTDVALVGSRLVPSLSPGVQSYGAASVTVTSTTIAGTYHVLACADAAKRIAEGNSARTGEANNCRATSSTIVIKP